ncbi:hypothetical protein SNEBB_002745 [Seison nebaliae]|nr:hypothetical protein SNEBB_002745 [Seison nebaliae]
MHQSGIQPDEQLQQFLVQCKANSIRSFKVNITDTEMKLSEERPMKCSFDDDFNECVTSMIRVGEGPCYIFCRMDTGQMEKNWLFISYMPEKSTVRDKMLHASSKATLKKAFGLSLINEELNIDKKSELTLAAYKKHLQSKNEPRPLTEREQQLNNINHSIYNCGMTAKRQTMQPLKFPLSSSASLAIDDYRNETVNYVEFEINIEKEVIELIRKEKIDPHQIPEHLPDDSARYVLVRFYHIHEKQMQNASIFLYYMPGYNCPVKQRMLYSSCKTSVIDYIQSKNVQIDRKMEVSDKSELTADMLYSDLHPPSEQSQHPSLQIRRPQLPTMNNNRRRRV